MHSTLCCFVHWISDEVECQSLCGSEVTYNIKQLEIEGTCTSAP